MTMDSADGVSNMDGWFAPPPPHARPVPPVRPEAARPDTAPYGQDSEWAPQPYGQEPGPESFAEPFAEPLSQTYAESPVSFADPYSQPYAEPLAQPFAQPFPEPVAERHAQPFAEPYAEPLAEPYAQPFPEPYAEPLAQRHPESFAEPSAQPLAQPYARPFPEPHAQPFPKPHAEPFPEPHAQPFPEPYAPSSAESHDAYEPYSEPAAQSHNEPHPAPRQPYAEAPAQPEPGVAPVFGALHEVPESDTAETPPDHLQDESLPALLSSALQVLRAESVAELTAAGYQELDPLHARAFAELQARGGCTSSELGEAMELTPTQTAQLLKELERRSYLRRDPSLRGPRHVRYLLNEKALQLLRATGYVQARLEGKVAQRLGPVALGELRGGLIQLIRAQGG